MSYQPLNEKTGQHVPSYTPGAMQVQSQTLNFNPLDDKQKFPYRNTFEPFLFRLVTLACAGGAYVVYLILCAVVPIVAGGGDAVISAAAAGGAFPLLLCLGALLYFAKPDYWVKVDRLSMELLITKTRSGGYCSSGPQIRIPLAQVRDVIPLNGNGCCGACLGRTWTIEVNMVDGHSERLSALCDLTTQRAHTEANKLMNAIRLSRGEPLIVNV